MQITPQEPTLFVTHDPALNIMCTQDNFISLAHPMKKQAIPPFLPWSLAQRAKLCLFHACRTISDALAWPQQLLHYRFARKPCTTNELKQDSKTPGKCQNCSSALAILSLVDQKLGRLGRHCQLLARSFPLSGVLYGTLWHMPFSSSKEAIIFFALSAKMNSILNSMCISQNCLSILRTKRTSPNFFMHKEVRSLFLWT